MKFPLNYYADFSPYVGLLVAFLIGNGFGFMLERAGFGSGRKLAGQFYFKDFTVLKVMFTAVVVAGVGYWGLVLMGVLDISATFINPTFLWAQLIGGLILGVGMVMGGYCPGTSCVAVATGRIDAIAYIGGVLFGILVYSEVAPLMTKLQNAGSMGTKYVWEVLHISPGMMMLIAVFMAVGSFTWASYAEKKNNSVIQPD